MVRVSVTSLPKRSAATKVSIAPPEGKARVDENRPLSSCKRGAPFKVRRAVWRVLPETVRMPSVTVV